MPQAIDSSFPGLTMVPQGDRSLLLFFGDKIDVEIGRRCAAAAAVLRAAAIEGVTDIVPAFTSVAVHYRPSPFGAHTGLHQLVGEIERVLGDTSEWPAHAESSKVVDIPVCYGGKHGPDLDYVAEHCKLEPKEVIRLHSEEPAYVFMLGFAPGAPYIGVHDQRLTIGRRATPRTLLPAGSVAIANLQTMIYPNASPGGWHVIGATPSILFDPTKEEPALLAPGDTVRFVPVSVEAFEALRDGRP